MDYRAAVNVRSQQRPPELLYLAVDNFAHPVLNRTRALPDGFTELSGPADGPALDYVRGNLFQRDLMRPVPTAEPGPENDLGDFLDHYVRRAVGDPEARAFVFGQAWGPEPTTPDKVFRFSPGNGVHDVHMNQGNSGRFADDDGVFQDGALLLHFPADDTWVAIFLAFQSQSVHTDDTTGHTLPDTPGPGPQAGPDHLVRIVGALANPAGPAPEAETVTLLNTTPGVLDLTGWALLDRAGNRHPLTGSLPAGDTLRVGVAPPLQLGNQGGTITLLDPRGLKVDGVAYTAEQARREGWSITF
ncbi:hypothetical protein GCM10010172_56890 [Paractinoplanes ferrugineus]|uniref:LTD domain-containing protein n=1 Tax=Paractinoplanes ferrugineus TaxID=113564 RepID=A0A919IXE7_9ACTN|nr:hypothetical protein Afe05nite_26810 [Actinoplanes ferrugineus]